MIRGKSILIILKALGKEPDERVLEVLDIIEKSKEGVSENTMADKLDIKINDVRKALYKLNEWGVVTYVKKKDESKKWWYVFCWSIDEKRLENMYLQYMRRELVSKEKELADERKFAFQCLKCKRKFEYEAAIHHGFHCPDDTRRHLLECKNSKYIKQLEKEISHLKRELQ